MTTSIFFSSRRINVPGAYSELDASALAGIGPGPIGVVALLGTAVGGKPKTVEESFADATRPETLRKRYRSGDLRTAAEFAFSPSQDEAVPGGAQRVVSVKVNPATQSQVTLPDGSAADSVDLTSKDWGQFTEQINVEVAAGTNRGKKITVVFEDLIETFDDVGGDAIMDLEYTPGSNGYSTATAAITASAFTVAATKTGIDGEDDEIASQLGGADTLQVVSAAAGDTSQSVTIYGLDGSNVPIQETIALNGTTPVAGSVSFTVITGVLLSAVTTGDVSVESSDGLTTHVTITAGGTDAGLSITTNTPAAGVVTLSSSADQAGAHAVVRGLGSSGQEVAERFALDGANATPVVGSTTFSRITQIELGAAAAAETVTLDLNAFQTSHDVFPTIQRVVDRLNALDAFTATALVAGPTTFLVANADYAAAVNVLSTTGQFFAENFNFVSTLNTRSTLVQAARATGATAGPANTTDPVFLAGGSEGTPTATDWQDCFDLLKKRRVNIIVPLTADAAIHAQLLNHLKYRAGQGRSEANGYIGIGTSGGAGETRANIKSEIVAVQNRNISAVSQEVERFDPATGEATWWAPHFLAAIAAGAQAGSSIAEPLTHKLIQCTDVRQDSSWNPLDDQSEMIDAGLMVAEKIEGIGIRWVRSVSTHIADDNLAFSEMSANESLNTFIFELRSRIEASFVGNKGLGASAGAIKSKARSIAEDLVEDEIIFGFKEKSLTVEQVGDVFPVSIEASPIGPINFVPITVHVTAPVAQAA